MSDYARTRLSFAEATSIIAGYGIGGGVLALPYLVSRNGVAEKWAVGGMAALFVALSAATVALRLGSGGPARG
jgi:amino acid permease